MSYAGSTTVMVDVDPHWSSLGFTTAIDRRNGLGGSAQFLPANTGHNQHSAAANGPGSHAQQGNETFILVDATRLVHRWNLANAQANLWLFAGVGSYDASGTRTLVISDQSQTTTLDPNDPGNNHHNHFGLIPAPSPTTITTQFQTATLLTTPSALRIAARPGLQFDAETTRLRFEGRAMLYLAPGIQRPLLSATAGTALTGANYKGVQTWLELQVRAMPGLVDQLELTPKLRFLHQRVVVDVGYSNLGSVVGSLTYTF